ncbi:MAG: serine/threonine protein kinase [Ruminococcus sp.]|nr:serine/threonine protein kinase [Ruminococcus sp.]
MNNTELIEQILSQIRQPLWENWYIQEKIGSGAYSAVYRVTAERIQRTDVSALKIEPLVPGENTLGDEERMRRSVEEKRELCVNESTIMYELRNCPYIVAYEDEDIRELVVDGKFEGYYFLIRMEYLDCLTDLLKAKKFDVTEQNIAALAHDIGSGIKAAHDIGVIHRDVKPANFFVNAKGVYKLGDFNISKQTVSCDTFAGTNSYIAPEVRFAKSGDSYTCQADIYSLGICLYQLMNGLYLPFEDTMPLKEAIDRRMSGEALPAPKNASPEFARVILKACAFSTEERYRNIDEFLADLAGMYKKHEPKAAQPVSTAQAYAPKQPAPQDPYLDPAAYPVQKKNPAVIIAVILVILAIVGGIAAYMFLSGGDDDDGDAPAAEELVPITEMELSTEDIYIGVYEALDITELNCPDELSMSEELPDDLFSYSYRPTLYARNDELIITVNDDATENLKCDAPKGVDVSAVLEDGEYNISIDVAEACDELEKGDSSEYRIVFTNSDESIQEDVEVKVELVGPFSDEGVKFTSSDDRVIEFTEDEYFLRGTGEALVNIVYDGEIIYSRKVTVTE